MRKPPEPKFNGRILRFIAEYLVDQNGSAAMRRISPHLKEASARSQAQRYMADPKIRAEIERLLKETLERSIASREHVLREMSRIGLSNPRLLFNEDGSMKDIKDMPEEIQTAIKTIETTPIPGTGRFSVKVTFWDKNTALANLGKFHKILTDHVEHSGKVTLEALVAESMSEPDKKSEKKK
jgi:hypothetical protein